MRNGGVTRVTIEAPQALLSIQLEGHRTMPSDPAFWTSTTLFQFAKRVLDEQRRDRRHPALQNLVLVLTPFVALERRPGPPDGIRPKGSDVALYAAILVVVERVEVPDERPSHLQRGINPAGRTPMQGANRPMARAEGRAGELLCASRRSRERLRGQPHGSRTLGAPAMSTAATNDVARAQHQNAAVPGARDITAREGGTCLAFRSRDRDSEYSDHPIPQTGARCTRQGPRQSAAGGMVGGRKQIFLSLRTMLHSMIVLVNTHSSSIIPNKES